MGNLSNQLRRALNQLRRDSFKNLRIKVCSSDFVCLYGSVQSMDERKLIMETFELEGVRYADELRVSLD